MDVGDRHQITTHKPNGKITSLKKFDCHKKAREYFNSLNLPLIGEVKNKKTEYCRWTSC